MESFKFNIKTDKKKNTTTIEYEGNIIIIPCFLDKEQMKDMRASFDKLTKKINSFADARYINGQKDTKIHISNTIKELFDINDFPEYELVERKKNKDDYWNN